MPYGKTIDSYIVTYLQQFESYVHDQVSWSEPRGLSVDVESAVVDTSVLSLVEEVVELQFEVNEFQFQLCLGITKPCVTIGCSEVVVVVLG